MGVNKKGRREDFCLLKTLLTRGIQRNMMYFSLLTLLTCAHIEQLPNVIIDLTVTKLFTCVCSSYSHVCALMNNSIKRCCLQPESSHHQHSHSPLYDWNNNALPPLCLSSSACSSPSTLMHFQRRNWAKICGVRMIWNSHSTCETQFWIELNLVSWLLFRPVVFLYTFCIILHCIYQCNLSYIYLFLHWFKHFISQCILMLWTPVEAAGENPFIFFSTGSSISST